jgi:hypothetical protein
VVNNKNMMYLFHYQYGLEYILTHWVGYGPEMNLDPISIKGIGVLPTTNKRG